MSKSYLGELLDLNTDGVEDFKKNKLIITIPELSHMIILYTMFDEDFVNANMPLSHNYLQKESYILYVMLTQIIVPRSRKKETL